MPYKNKEERKEYEKKYREKNKEKLASYDKAFQESKKDGLFTVYLIVNENYVGQTISLHKRLQKHKNSNNRDVSNVQIIGKYKTREEAKAVESEYHSKGYLGYYRGH